MTFRIYAGEELVRTETLTQDIIKVGKLPSSHLRIDDDNVSRMHAVIEVTGPDEIFIIDLGSASGTVVNGKKVNKCKLEHGDEVVLGDTRVVVEIGGAGAQDEAPTVVAAGAPAVAPPPPPGAPAIPKPSVPNPFAVKAPPNPFAAPAAPAAAAASHGHDDEDEDPEQVSYGIVASGPPVHPDEVEVSDQAVEVVVMWGDRQVLHVEHLSPVRPFYVGEPGAGPIDYLMGSEVLGTARMPLVVATGMGAAAVIPQGATGSVTVGDQTMSIADLRAGGKLQPCVEATGAEQYPIPPGATVKVEHNGFTFVSKQVNAGKKIAGGVKIDWQPLSYVLGSMAIFGILLTLMYFIPPAGGGLNLDLLNTDSRLVQYLLEPPATEEEETPEWLENSEQQDDAGGKGKRHKGEEGAMGKKEAKKTNNRYAIEGPADNQDPHMAREAAREQARNAGVLGTLRAMTGAWDSPTSPFGRDTALGNDPMSALGALMGDQIGENFGYGGLGLRGTGRGGGGTGEGTIGLGNLGTIGHGGGGGSGQGYGRGAGGFRGRDARVPQIRSGTAEVRGSLSREVIQRVIRRHINEVKFCYEQELNSRPDLEGRVTVRFIISPTGSVQTAMVQATTLGNQRVESCISQAVQRWTFPAPDGGGIVIVNYPFMLQSAGG
ncbi:MAG: AgmX/PglI C-terminal domain-containing protein [Myxococcales bacterium]|nr:AgmX/PglI C-terminal domain-containing protein [Myxococcales bacterium]